MSKSRVPSSKVDRSRFTKLEQLPNIGPSIAGDLRRLRINSPADLVSQDPYEMYDRLCTLTRHRHDPCLLDTFIAVTRFMAGDPAKPWWHYTAERKRKMKSANR